MKNGFLFGFLLLLSCQTDNTSFSLDPAMGTYSDEAPMTQKLYCNSVNCENPSAQETYTYNTYGQLTRVDVLNQMGTGKLELSYYTDYFYDAKGQLTSRIRYGRHNSTSNWIRYDESEYVYKPGSVIERIFFNQRNPDQRVLTGQNETLLSDGKKVALKRYDAQMSLLNQVAYEYRNNTIIRETWLDSKGNAFRVFGHQFAGNRRQVSEFLPNSPEQLSMVEKTYDAQGRLSSEETKVINPLLCTMQAGTIRYVY